MAVLIPYLVKCDVYTVNDLHATIHHHFSLWRGCNVPRQHVTKWIQNFNFRRTKIHNEDRSGSQSDMTDDNVQKIEENALTGHCLTNDNLHTFFPNIL